MSTQNNKYVPHRLQWRILEGKGLSTFSNHHGVRGVLQNPPMRKDNDGEMVINVMMVKVVVMEIVW